MRFWSMIIIIIGAAIAFHEARSGKRFLESVLDGVLDATVLQACVRAIAVLFAVASAWPLIATETVATAALAGMAAMLGALAAKLVPAREPVAHW